MIIKDTNYNIAEDGTVSNLKSGIILKPQCNGKGYLKVYLLIDGKKRSKYIHRLVAEAFIKKPRKRYCDQVNHKDGNKHNNDISNLEWVTNGENQRHRHKLKKKQIIKTVRYEKIIFNFEYVLVSEENKAQSAQDN